MCGISFRLRAMRTGMTLLYMVYSFSKHKQL